ncbi:tRNA (guanosine(37)-N1)-methyltransferase TrmD [candidate division GN15 bacterium]|uniref:tRNA (guanine-N(1)-)-methyltransferase n=1 Tax=candidate division GN15 bacterium TaxID=2072418 RepID=A0A855X8E3_9BACT|nr:MAG: tRNA (guanosine(37)-N1)-methyltransferase TrmD [candidate division GN15 bacterium]
MKFELITLFPDYFSVALKQSLIGKAVEKKLFDIDIVNLRDFTTDKHHTADDQPFGGGGGMVMKIEPLDRALQKLGYGHKGNAARNEKERIILTSAAGVRFNQDLAVQYSLCERLTIICGHYLGVDERLMSLYDLDEVSIGDYILTGGEPAAAVILDAVARLMPKVLGNFESALNDSYMNQMLGAPCYTRPAEYAGLSVPEVIMSGNHAEITRYRRIEAIKKCLRVRPDLLETADLSDEELKLVDTLKKKMTL